MASLCSDRLLQTESVSQRQPTCGDLFAGAGGLSVGFHQAGFTSKFFNEIDQAAAATFSLNYPDTVPFVVPIEQLTADQIRAKTDDSIDGLDCMIGGPPCQGFSINAPIRSDLDPRNHLFRHYVRLVLEGVRPKVVLLENVPGLLSHNGGQTVKDVIQAFGDAGYRVIYKVLNAAHYGVPQERWRLFFLGTRLPEYQLSFPEPTHYSLQRPNFSGGREFTFSHAIGKPDTDPLFGGKLLRPITIHEAIGDLPEAPSDQEATVDYACEPFCDYLHYVRRGSKEVYDHVYAGSSSINLQRMSHVAQGGSWRDIPYDLLPEGMKRARRSDHTKRYGRLHPDGVSGTIMTKCDPHWGTVFHYNQNRIISVREAARFQSFPDTFKFFGTKIQKYKQVGNAVPVLLAKAVAKHIKQELERVS